MEVAVDNVIEESEGKNGSAIDDPSNNNKISMNDDNAAYESDYSLRIPISNVRFRGSQLHVIDTDHDQLILKQQLGNDEKKHNKTTLVKRLSHHLCSKGDPYRIFTHHHNLCRVPIRILLRSVTFFGHSVTSQRE
jgi:hypothetical protein